MPFVFNHLGRTLEAQRGRNGSGDALPENLLTANRMYVTCQIDEDLPYLLQFTGEDNVLMGSDYTHADQSQELDWPRLLQQRVDNGEIPQSLIPKVTYDNPRTFYGL